MKKWLMKFIKKRNNCLKNLLIRKRIEISHKKILPRTTNMTKQRKKTKTATQMTGMTNPKKRKLRNNLGRKNPQSSQKRMRRWKTWSMHITMMTRYRRRGGLRPRQLPRNQCMMAKRNRYLNESGMRKRMRVRVKTYQATKRNKTRRLCRN